jgi:hypothetical protein
MLDAFMSLLIPSERYPSGISALYVDIFGLIVGDKSEAIRRYLSKNTVR